MTRPLARPAPGVPAPPLAAPGTRVGVRVELEVDPGWPDSGIGPVETVAAQLPDPAMLGPGEWIAVMGGPKPRALGKLLPWRRPRVHPAVSCTALLLRGYHLVCADASGTAYGCAGAPAAGSPPGDPATSGLRF